jgi:hypothetical protein
MAALLLAAASFACGDGSPPREARRPVAPEKAPAAVSADTDSISAVLESPDVPPAILADLAEDWGWGELARGIGANRLDLDGRGEREYEIHGWCGSSGVCVSYVFRRDSAAGYARILSAETWEGPLEVLRHRTHGFHDIRSTAPPDGASVQGPAIYCYDGVEYRPNGIPLVEPYDLEVADLNLDGKPDLLSSGYLGTFSFHAGDGRGGFAPPVYTRTGWYTTATAAAELTGDGRPDLVVARESSPMYLLPGDGRGGFGARVPISDSATSVAVADMNGDRAADLVAVRGEYGNVDVLLNDGHGHFRARRSWSDTTWLTVLAAGDLDGDGHADAAVADRGKMGTERRITLLRGDGRGGLTTWARVENPGSDPKHVVIADADGDGRPEVLAEGERETIAMIAYRDGRFTLRKIPTGLWVDAFAVGDLNGDGKPDLVAATARYRNRLVALLGTGGGRFRRTARLPTGRWPSALAIADLNGDGRADVVTANEMGDDLGVLLGRGDGTFRPGPTIRLRRAPR